MLDHFVEILNVTNEGITAVSSHSGIFSIREIDSVIDEKPIVWLINIHLNWEGKRLSDNYGLEIANYIRTKKKSKAPIILYSPIQRKYFEKASEKEIRYKILFGRGTAFITTPIKEVELQKIVQSIPLLSNAALHDVITMLCDLKGVVIDKLNHDIKFDSDIDKAINSITPYLSNLQRQLINLAEFTHTLKSKVAANDRTGFLNEKLKFITLCNQELTDQGNNNPQKRQAKYSILIVDDLLEELAKAKEYLKNDFSIIETTEGEKAIDILKEDSNNEIVAVICDWRLFVDKNQNYWQPLQGYEVLDYAAKHGIRSLFALTSQADFVVHQLRNLMGIRFSMFKKENLNSAEQWRVFAEVLFEACKVAVEARTSILDSFPIWKKGWTKKGVEQPTLKKQYTDLWNSIDRDSEMNKVELKIEEMWNYLIRAKDPYLIGQEEYSEYGISQKVLELKKILVLRRIWFGLWFNNLPSGKMGSETLKHHTETVYRKMFGAPGEGSITQRTFNLCIQLDKIKPPFMLPEEVDWLNRKSLLG